MPALGKAFYALKRIHYTTRFEIVCTITSLMGHCCERPITACNMPSSPSWRTVHRNPYIDPSITRRISRLRSIGHKTGSLVKHCFRYSTPCHIPVSAQKVHLCATSDPCCVFRELGTCFFPVVHHPQCSLKCFNILGWQ